MRSGREFQIARRRLAFVSASAGWLGAIVDERRAESPRTSRVFPLALSSTKIFALSSLGSTPKRRRACAVRSDAASGRSRAKRSQCTVVGSTVNETGREQRGWAAATLVAARRTVPMAARTARDSRRA